MLSIITITKDDHIGLKNNLKSTKTLRESNFVEQIVIDGSTTIDKNKNVEYIKNKKNIKYFFQNPRGIYSAFNFGLNKSKFKWVLFLNSGDKYIAKDNDLILSILKNTRSKLIIFNYKRNNKVIKKPPIHSVWPPIPNWLPHPSTIFDRKLLINNGGFSKKYKIAGDYDLFIKILSLYIETDLISIPLSEFSEGGASSNKKEAGKESISIITRYTVVILKKQVNSFLRVLKGIKQYIIG